MFSTIDFCSLIVFRCKIEVTLRKLFIKTELNNGEAERRERPSHKSSRSFIREVDGSVALPQSNGAYPQELDRIKKNQCFQLFRLR